MANERREKMFIVPNRLIRCRKDQTFSAKVWDFVTAFVYIVYPSYKRLDFAYICTHPPQCANLLFFSAFSVR